MLSTAGRRFVVALVKLKSLRFLFLSLSLHQNQRECDRIFADQVSGPQTRGRYGPSSGNPGMMRNWSKAVPANLSRELREFHSQLITNRMGVTNSESDQRWGLYKDTWVTRGHSQFAFGSPHPLHSLSLPLYHLDLPSLSCKSRNLASVVFLPQGISSQACLLSTHLWSSPFALTGGLFCGPGLESAPACVCVSLSRALLCLSCLSYYWPQLCMTSDFF